MYCYFFQVIFVSKTVPIRESLEKCIYTVPLVLWGKSTNGSSPGSECHRYSKAKCNKMSMSQCLVFVKACDRRCISLDTCLLLSWIGFTILRRNISVGEESKPASIPAVTPDEVKNLPSCTHRARFCHWTPESKEKVNVNKSDHYGQQLLEI